LNARNEHDKVITVGESNNAGVWGRIRGFEGEVPDADAIFILFKKIRIFKHILV